MKNTVALVELGTHNEVLWAYIKILLAINRNIRVFCNPHVFAQLYDLQENTSIQWEIHEPSQILDQLITREHILENAELTIFTTVLPEHYQKITSFKRKGKIALVIHDIHSLFEPAKYFFWGTTPRQRIRNSLKICRHYLSNESKRNIQFLKTFDFWIFPSEEMSGYFQQTCAKTLWRPNTVVEFAVVDETPDIDGQIIEGRVVVPGSVSNKSRNYRELFVALSSSPILTQLKLEIILLGQPIGVYGKTMIRKFKDLENSSVLVQVFENFVHQKEFDRIMKSAQFLILPISPIMDLSPVREWNGRSCVSGNINDMVKYRKKAILPSFYPLPEELKETSLRYSHTGEIVPQLLAMGQMTKMDDKADKLIGRFGAAVNGKKLEEFLLAIK